MKKKNINFAPLNKRIRGVAQLVSAPRSGRGGRKFESSHPDQQNSERAVSQQFKRHSPDFFSPPYPIFGIIHPNLH